MAVVHTHLKIVLDVGTMSEGSFVSGGGARSEEIVKVSDDSGTLNPSEQREALFAMIRAYLDAANSTATTAGA